MAQQRGELGLSFIDVLSCGLGAMILLFLVFSVLSHRGSPDSASDSGLNVEQLAASTVRASSTEVTEAPLLFRIILSPQDGGTSGMDLLLSPENTPAIPTDWCTVIQEIGTPLGTDSFLLLVEKPNHKGDLWLAPRDKSVAVEICTIAGGLAPESRLFFIKSRGTFHPTFTYQGADFSISGE